MSCYNEERGYVTLTKKDFDTLRKRLVSAFSPLHAAAIDICLPVYRDVKKSKDTPAEYSSIECMALARLGEYEKKNSVKFAGSRRSYIVNLVTTFILVNRNRKIVKANVVNSLSKINTRTNSFQVFDTGYVCADILFNREKNTVHYEVFENNRAVERANSSLMGKMFFDFLNSVTWTKNTGGQFNYSDEYMRDEGEYSAVSRRYGKN